MFLGGIEMYKPIYPKGRGRYGNNYWEVYSTRINRVVKLYSDLEYDHWVLVEGNSNVDRFCEQPLKVVLYIAGKKYETIFDKWIKYKSGEEVFVEIKYSSELDPQNPKSVRALRQIEIQKAWCEERSFRYEIRTEQEIRKNPILLENTKALIPFIRNRRHPLELTCRKIVQLIRSQRVTLQQLYEAFVGQKTEIFEAICWLIFEGTLRSNIDQVRLGTQTEVWINDQK